MEGRITSQFAVSTCITSQLKVLTNFFTQWYSSFILNTMVNTDQRDHSYYFIGTTVGPLTSPHLTCPLLHMHVLCCIYMSVIKYIFFFRNRK